MYSEPPRRLSVLDVMILVAAVAVAAWVGRIEFVPWFTVYVHVGNLHHMLSWHWLSLVVRETQPLLAPVTLAVAAMRLARPRPGLRRLTVQPGFVACSGASLAILVGGIMNFAATKQEFVPGYQAAVYTCIALMPRGAEPGLAVAASWLMLAIGGRWRPGRNWIDRAGIVAGAYWLAMIPVSLLGTRH